MSNDEKLSYAILKHLENKLGSGSESKEVLDKVGNLLGVSLDDKSLNVNKSLVDIFKAGLESLSVNAGGDPVEQTENFKKYLAKVTEKGYFKGVDADSEEYKTRYGKLLAKYKEKFDTTPKEESTGNDTELGDKYKNEGNDYISKRDFPKAIEAYTKAIDVCPTGDNTYIYYCNRAAAYLYLKDYQAAYEDCAVTIGLNPTYAKGHARKAQAAMQLGNKEEAEEAANEALAIEPTNAVAKTILSQLGSSSAAAPTGGNPMADMMKGMDPSLLAGLGGGAGGGAGGMPDLGGLMNNPEMMKMAQQMMQDPNTMRMAQQMMQDPNAMANMMKMMGGGRK